jgi:hypothetical protein
MTDRDEVTSTDQLDQTSASAPTPDMPAESAPTGPPLTHHEPTAMHARDEQAVGGHVDEHMSDEHGHGDVRLGPIDWGAWGYALVGLAAGLIVVAAFWLALA